jgi:hypothetical protein
MKKAILTVGLFSLMMVLTSFTNEIGGGTRGSETRKEIGGGGTQGSETRSPFHEIGGGGTQGSETRKDIGGGGTGSETRG